MQPDLQHLAAEARDKLAIVAGIFTGRDGKTTASPSAHIFKSKVFGRIYIHTTGEPFDLDFERQLIISNIELHGGFRNVTVVLRNGERSMLVRAIYDGVEKPSLEHEEHTLGDLLDFIDAHPNDFPDGFDTPITLGDYEGNTLHRNFSVCEDNGRLHLSFELNESDDE